jgi:ERF superfamily protein
MAPVAAALEKGMSAIVKTDGTLATRDQLPVTSLLEVISRAASDPSVDIEKMERLMQMHERITAKDAEIAFNTAMTACQVEMPRVLRNKPNDSTSSKYADLEQLDKICRPIYTKHGFSLSFGTTDCPLAGHARQTCLVSHTGGHSRAYQADIPLDLTGPKGNANKTGVQGFGSTMSYGQRYLTKLIFNIALTNEDNDGQRSKGNGGDTDPINEEQIANIEALLTELGKDKKKFLTWAKVDSIDQIVVGAYSETIKTLEAMRR